MTATTLHDPGTISGDRPSPDRRSDIDARTEPAPPPVLEIVVPVYNEQGTLETSIRTLHHYLDEQLLLSWRITIADNASTDSTWPLACTLSRELAGVRCTRVAAKGRGRALHAVWSQSDAAVLAYMDVDLSTDLNALQPLIAPLLSGHSDIAIGTRLARGSRVIRGPKREVISRGYNALLRTVLRVGFTDAQCGFKAIRRDVAERLLPLVEDRGWFFDTELLVLAERAGLRIHEVPVDWYDDPDTRVDIASTAFADLRGIGRLTRGLATGAISLDQVRSRTPIPDVEATLPQQVMRFVAIGVASTAAYLVLFLLLRMLLGAFAANGIALLVTAIANTAVNRRLTFGVRTSRGAARHQLQGLVVFGVALAVTSLSLTALHALSSRPGRATEAVVLVAANLVATAVRFLLLRHWVFPTRTVRSL